VSGSDILMGYMLKVWWSQKHAVLADFSFKKVIVVGSSDHPALCAFLFKFLNISGDFYKSWYKHYVI